MPSKQRSVTQRISVSNLAQERRKIQLGFDLRAGVVYKRGASAFFPNSPGEPDNQITWSPAKGCLVLTVGPQKGVANTVFLKDISRGKIMYIPEHRRSLDQKQCRYEPHILLVPENGSVPVKSSDAVLHTVHMDGAASYNLTDVPPGQIPDRGLA